MADPITGPIDPKLTSDAPPPPAAEPPKPDKFEETINRLVGVTKKASEDVQLQRQENNEIRSALAALASQVERLAPVTQPAPAGNPPLADTLSAGTLQSQPSGPGAPLDAEAVRGMIAEAFQQQVNLTNETAQLQAVQRATYQECLQELPAIADVSTPEGKAFNRIYAGRPDLQAMPDGPRLAMILARDAANQGRLEGRNLADRKDRARVLQDASPRAEVTADQLRKLEESHKSLVDEGMKRPLSDDELGSYLDSKLALEDAKARGLL
jgi:hypothetical protein